MSELAGNAMPTTGAERSLALDVTRGIAVFGIFACNIWFFANPMGTMRFPGMIGTEYYQMEAFKAFMGFLDGTQRGLFSIMFGAGTVLFMDRLTDKGLGMRAADLYFRRTILLFLFGLMNAWLFLWHGDILYHYAIVSFIVFALRNAKTKTILIIVLGLIAWNTGKATLNYQDRLEQFTAYETAMVEKEAGAELSSEAKGAIRTYERFTNYAPTLKQSEADIEKVQSGYWGSYEIRSRWIKAFESTIFYNVFFIDILIMMLLGVLLYRYGWLTNQRSTADYLKMLVLGLAIGWTIRYLKIDAVYGADAVDPLAQSFWNIFYSIDRPTTAMGYLAGIQLLVRVGFLNWFVKGFAAAGRMALTNYLMQSIICMWLFLGFGFGWYGTLMGVQHYYVVLAVMVVSILWSVIWLKYFRFGPFEWVWRSLTYGAKQPMKR